jgi:carboxyl-terminal processing protease
MEHRFRFPLRACAAAGLLLAGAALADEPAPHAAALAELQSAYVRAVGAGAESDLYRDLFPAILQRVQRSYAFETDLGALVRAAANVIEPLPPGANDPADVFKKAVNEALQTLDGYSRYIDPRSHANDRAESGGRFGGLGLEVETGGGAVRVIAPIAGSPAARAGLQRGDVLVRVDEQSLLGLPLAEAIARMRGEPGTPVSLTVRRPGAPQEFTVSLKREVIRRQLLRWHMEDEVLVLRLGTFSGAVTAALQEAIDEATAAHAPAAVVLDMRGNTGGLLREAVTTADVFLREGEIASLRGRTPYTQRVWNADDKEWLAGVPMVVLIDGRSASATELVAAALQDNGRATVMGQRSYGKGTVQTTYSLGENKGALKLTTSHYHGPGGRAVQKAGVMPDIELVGTSGSEHPEAKAVRVEQARCPAQLKVADAGLACAIGYLRAGGVDAFLGATAHQP